MLDLSNNKLRDLGKILDFLERFKFLKQLNLRGNPCCEEPDYRLTVLYKLPWLHIFDQHVVTASERRVPLPTGLRLFPPAPSHPVPLHNTGVPPRPGSVARPRP